jgi:hypothetical protein
MRRTAVTLALIASSHLAAQQAPAAAPASPPEGWTIRLDAKDSAMKAADTHFVTMGPGFHVTSTSGPAALYFNAKDVATGAYTVHASFGQRVAPAMGHPEAYGVFIGGTQLTDDAKQQYFYFEVRGDGKYFVAHRAGPDVHKIVDWTAHDAVKKQNEAGAVSNEVAMKVTADSVHMMVNGQTVKAFAKSELHGFNTDGQYGFRVNHGLNVHIANFGLQK